MHDTMHRYCRVPRVAESCLLVAHAFCSMNERNGEIASELEVHSTCVDIMKSYADNAIIQGRCLAAFVGTGSGPKSVSELKYFSVLQTVEAAVGTFPFSKEIHAQGIKVKGLVQVGSSHARCALNK